ncbi:MAG: DUF2141 domain-containing protein [Ignavibacteriaceae bacterium]|jgi:uncharacterized protein (DUF2141 family)|nr:DUF2141 domain-containing protein [Ignavibacteriaceae bacterium]MCW8812574.1 DUF2141 domain-containing protein [Chlorobium sp.]MCW8818450.1 DUF2141 domain-containing protein [Ignavibacteriaceae bacterium]MCW8823386.1 DUF2141 domain-containing protein [Ignavibacteriaceae bacterium]MCW9095228.1 DUF2141 domain-containing protein [Ignavibacteriaceae bacterium]
MINKKNLKRFPVNFLLILIFYSVTFLFPQDADSLMATGKLTVIIKGFESDVGNCRFALDDSKEVYEREDSVWIGKVLPIQNEEVVVTIDSLQYGEYAVRVYQDKNKNAELDTDILGIPTENYGFSNNASGWFGPPSWDKAKFIFNKPEVTIQIDID